MKRIWIFPSLSMSSAVSVTSCEMALAVFGCWVNEGSGDTLRGICVSVRLMRAVLLPRVGSNRSELPETHRRSLTVASGAVTTEFNGSFPAGAARCRSASLTGLDRSEEHTSELQPPCNLVCRLLLEK